MTLDRNQIVCDLEDWIYDVLSVRYEALNNNRACAFAKTAWTQNQVAVYLGDIDMGDLAPLLEEKEVVVCVFDPMLVSANDLEEKAAAINEALPEIVALEDHPDVEEQVQDVVFNQGKYGLLLIQRRDKLNKARDHLKESGYYMNWDLEYYNEVVDR